MGIWYELEWCKHNWRKCPLMVRDTYKHNHACNEGNMWSDKLPIQVHQSYDKGEALLWLTLSTTAVSFTSDGFQNRCKTSASCWSILCQSKLDCINLVDWLKILICKMKMALFVFVFVLKSTQICSRTLFLYFLHLQTFSILLTLSPSLTS